MARILCVSVISGWQLPGVTPRYPGLLCTLLSTEHTICVHVRGKFYFSPSQQRKKLKERDGKSLLSDRTQGHCHAATLRPQQAEPVSVWALSALRVYHVLQRTARKSQAEWGHAWNSFNIFKVSIFAWSNSWNNWNLLKTIVSTFFKLHIQCHLLQCLKSTMERVFTPRKLVNATNLGIFFSSSGQT